jgi:hypothetical protein
MFALVARVKLREGETIEIGREQLDNATLPALRQAPGFVSAIFLYVATEGEGLGIVTFRTEEDANAARDNFRIPPGITPISLEVHEVARAT